MKQTLNEEIGRIKSMMNLNEDESQAMLQQDTEEFNQKVGEDLTPEEYKEVICSNPDNLELPNIGNEEMQKVSELKEKMKTASFDELMQLKRQLKELKRQQQNEQVAGPAVITLLGVSMPPAFAMVIGGIVFIMILSFLSKFIRFNKKTTYYCDGTRSRGLFGLLRW
jgi:hypothetical protein